MMTAQELRDALMACKLSGRWARIAKHAKCDYNHLTRIARGDATPSLDLAGRIIEALAATESAPATTQQAA